MKRQKRKNNLSSPPQPFCCSCDIEHCLLPIQGCLTHMQTRTHTQHECDLSCFTVPAWTNEMFVTTWETVSKTLQPLVCHPGMHTHTPTHKHAESERLRKKNTDNMIYACVWCTKHTSITPASRWPSFISWRRTLTWTRAVPKHQSPYENLMTYVRHFVAAQKAGRHDMTV